MILLSLFVVSFNNLRAFIPQKVVWRGVDFGVNVVGKILKKGGRKQSSVTLVTVKKQHCCWKARAYSRVRV